MLSRRKFLAGMVCATGMTLLAGKAIKKAHGQAADTNWQPGAAITMCKKKYAFRQNNRISKALAHCQTQRAIDLLRNQTERYAKYLES